VNGSSIATMNIGASPYNEAPRSYDDISLVDGLETNSLVDEEDYVPKAQGTKDSKLGWLLILAVVVIWVASSFVVQHIEGEFLAPFFLTFSCTSLFMLLLPISYLAGRMKGLEWSPVEAASLSDTADSATATTVRMVSVRQIFRASMLLCPLWFTANLLYNLSLSRTSVTSSTILSGTSAIFTLGLGRLFKLEKVTFRKTLGVAACIWGTVMVGLADRSAPSADKNDNSLSGDMFSLLSAFFYACYTLLIEKLFPDGDESVKMEIVFGFVGVINFVLLCPVVAWLHFSGMESLHGLTAGVFGLIVLKGLMDNVLADCLWARAVLLTSPTVTTVGLSLTIPLSTIIDILVKQAFPSILTISGAILVTAGFIAVSIASDRDAHSTL